MNNEYLISIGKYVIEGHTIKETAQHFNKSESSIQKYLAKIRNPQSENYNEILAEKLKLAQLKMELQGRKKDGSNGKRGKTYEEFTARMYAEAYLSGLTIKQLADLSGIPKSTLHDMIREIDDEKLQKVIDEYTYRGIK